MNIFPFKFKKKDLRNNVIVALVGFIVLYTIISIEIYFDETLKEVEQYLLNDKEFQRKYGDRKKISLYKKIAVQPSITVENERTLGYSIYYYKVFREERGAEIIAVYVEDKNEDGIHEFRIEYRR